MSNYFRDCFGRCDKDDTSSAVCSSNSDNWPTSPLWTDDDHKWALLSDKHDTRYSPDLSVDEIVEKSSQFPIPFPIETVRCNHLKETISADILEKNINSVYPVIHENALQLCSTFLSYQRRFGNTDVYKDMSLIQFIDRLLSKRAVAFVGSLDHYVLLDKSESYGGWEKVGTPDEKPLLVLENCLSYDEIKLSALLSVSSHTCFINDGSRHNRGKPEEDVNKIERTGVVVGLIGTRLTKEMVMEYREIVKSKKQNTRKNGYGKKSSLQHQFLEFYGDVNVTYRQISKQLKTRQDRYVALGGDKYFDKLMYQRRVTLSIDTLLIEANDRAKRENTKAFVHVVGIGLGVWRICPEQFKLFCDICAKRLEFLKDSLLNVSDVYFAYIHQESIGNYQDGDQIGGITIHIGRRNPHEKLTGTHIGKLLVVSYAWDGNALPGNEFWFGSLDTSSDPAAACSTQVAELHNYHINGKLRGSALRVATLQHGLLTFPEYRELHKHD